MSGELLGVFAAAIALGTLIVLQSRSNRNDARRESSLLRDELGVLRGQMGASEDSLRKQMSKGLDGLRGEMKTGFDELRAEMKAGDDALRAEIGGLRVDMQTGFKELNTRVGTVEQRLAKVEGVIEGLFLSGRAEPPDQSREGAA